jgi:hypothetical protein
MLKVAEDGTWLGIRSRMGIRLAGIACSILAAWVVRAIGTLFGADFVVSDRFGTLHVTEAVCANFAFQVGIKGLVLILLLERLTHHARSIWTVGGWFLLVVSYWPIVVVEASPASKIFLALINTATAVVFISAVRSNVGRPDPRLHPAVHGLLCVAAVVFAVYTLGGLVPVISDYMAPLILPVDVYLLPLIGLAALISLVVSTVRDRARAHRGKVGVVA